MKCRSLSYTPNNKGPTCINLRFCQQGPWDMALWNLGGGGGVLGWVSM